MKEDMHAVLEPARKNPGGETLAWVGGYGERGLHPLQAGRLPGERGPLSSARRGLS